MRHNCQFDQIDVNISRCVLFDFSVSDKLLQMRNYCNYFCFATIFPFWNSFQLVQCVSSWVYWEQLIKEGEGLSHLLLFSFICFWFTNSKLSRARYTLNLNGAACSIKIDFFGWRPLENFYFGLFFFWNLNYKWKINLGWSKKKVRNIRSALA